MENLKYLDNWRLLNALESLSISIGFVSTAVEMVHDELCVALLASALESASSAVGEVAVDPTQQHFDFEIDFEAG